MASIKRDGRDGKWLARWRDPDHKQRKRSFDRKIDAQRFLTEVESSMHRNSYVDLSAVIKVGEYARQWAAGRPHRPTTADRTAQMIDVHIARTPLGGRKLVEVRQSEVQAWATGRAAVLADTTVRRTLSLLRTVFASAVHDQLIARSPVVRIVLPAAAKKTVIPLTIAEVRRLADAVPENKRAMIVTQAGLGLRIGELLGLQVGDVDFEARTVRIARQVRPLTRELVAVKTPTSKRTIPMPQVVEDALAAYQGEDAAKLLWTTQAGNPIGATGYRERTFTVAARRAGLPEGTAPHALRHHFASVLLAAGQSVFAVAELLGHQDPALVISTYGHLMPGTEDSTRAAIDAAWCATTAPQTTQKTL